jgi:ubiquitin carboxyl-terminal hydrolase 16/45
MNNQLQLNKLDSLTNPEKIDDVPEIPNKDDIDINNSIMTVTSYGEFTSNSNSKFKKVVKSGIKLKKIIKQDHSKPFAPRYQCDEGECSIQSCLNTFTAIELLTGNDKVGCDNCTLQKNGKDGRTVYTQASKQFMISSPPAVLILHLKRFQVEARYMYRKITKFVSFPMVLDIAPFCSSNISRLENIKPNQTKILYSLYGIVEHSGSMHCGHYIAYVKVRSQVSVNDKERWSFLSKFSKTNLMNTFDPKLENDNGINDGEDVYDSDDSSSKNEPLGAEGGSDDPDIKTPSGKWYYVSDSHVREVSEEEVSKAQAYLLFYERIY